MGSMLFIRKESGVKKDAFRVTSELSIPDFLRSSVCIDEDNIVHLVCVEGDATCPIDTVIGYEKSEQTRTGWNTWPIGNAKTNLIERDGMFFKKATVFQAELLSDEFPAFLAGAPIVRNDDGSWTITTDWGSSTGFPRMAYWVRYGTKANGKPDANILTKTEKSYQEYFVCTEDGKIIGKLAEIDPA